MEEIEKLREYIEKSNRIVFFGGAGVSTESGIPDFRSKDGLYNQHDVNFEKYRPEYRQNQDTMLWYDGMMAGTKHANIPDVVLRFRMTDTMFKKRRNGWAFAKKQLTDRLQINKDLKYGRKADLFGYAMFLLLISPPFVKKVAYRVFR